MLWMIQLEGVSKSVLKVHTIALLKPLVNPVTKDVNLATLVQLELEVFALSA